MELFAAVQSGKMSEVGSILNSNPPIDINHLVPVEDGVDEVVVPMAMPHFNRALLQILRFVPCPHFISRAGWEILILSVFSWVVVLTPTCEIIEKELPFCSPAPLEESRS